MSQEHPAATERFQIALIIVAVAGTKIGAWTWAYMIGSPWPIVGWFAVALTFAAAGGDSDMP